MVQPGQAAVVIPSPAPVPAPAYSKADAAFDHYTNVLKDHESSESRFRKAYAALLAAQNEIRAAEDQRNRSQSVVDDAQTAYRDALDASNGGTA